MEKIAISENPLMKAEMSTTNDVRLIEESCETKKIELNANAKEFVPLQCLEDNPIDATNARKNVVNGRNGDSRPMFMNGMTEQSIQGPLMGNGRDPEIPYVRYFSNGQSIDFFNKKYFVNGPSGDILFRPDGATEENKDFQKPVLLENGNSDCNIFRPPFINAMVEDILHRQYLLAFGGKSLNCLMPMERRRTKSSPQNSFQRYFPPKDFQRNERFAKDVSSANTPPEVWTTPDDYGDMSKVDSTSDDSVNDPTINSPIYPMDDTETCEYKLPKYSKVDLYNGDKALNESPPGNSDQSNFEIDPNDITIQIDISKDISDLDNTKTEFPPSNVLTSCSDLQNGLEKQTQEDTPIYKAEPEDVENLCHSTSTK